MELNPPPMEQPLLSNTTPTSLPSLDSYQIDALLVIRCMIYLILVYRAIEILLSQNQKLTARDRITQRYSFANAELIGSLNREDCELMSTTIRNTIANVKITEDGIKQRNKGRPSKSVKFSERHLYYDPVVVVDTEEIEPPTVELDEERLGPVARIERPVLHRPEPVISEKPQPQVGLDKDEEVNNVEQPASAPEKQQNTDKVDNEKQKQPQKKLEEIKEPEKDKEKQEKPPSEDESAKLVEDEPQL